MIKAIKLVFKKWYTWLSWIPLLGFFFPINDIKYFNWYEVEHGIIIVIGIFLFAAIVVIKELNISDFKIDERPKSYLKPLPANFELETIQKENFEWIFKVGSYFTPDSMPEEDRFIEEIEMSKTRCKNCKNEIKKNISTGYNPRAQYAQCPNQECELHEAVKNEYELESLEEQEKLKFISSVRLDFDKSWQIYCRKYNKITNGKNDEFVQPIRNLYYKR